MEIQLLGCPWDCGISVADMKEESSFIEAAYAVFMNNIEMDGNGKVLNYKYAEKRAAQYIRRYYEPGYIVEPPFEVWETELHEI